MFVYPSDTVLIRLRILSFVAVMGLRDDTTCIIKPTVRKLHEEEEEMFTATESELHTATREGQTCWDFIIVTCVHV